MTDGAGDGPIRYQRRSEEKLALYQEIVANSSDGVAIIDLQGVYLEQNAAHRALTGFEDRELEGRTPAIHLGEEVFARVAEALATVGVFQGDVTSTTKLGDRREIELSGYAVRDDAKQTVCYVCIARDARRAAAVLDNARLNREAQESDRRKEEFLAVLAHELRNPLAPILNSLELIRMEPEDRATRANSHAILERQVRNLKRLVDDLLDVSRVTRGKIKLQKERVTLDSIVANAVETARPLLQQHQVTLTTTVMPNLSLEVDPLRMEQVLANLLSNAARYTTAGTVHVVGALDGDTAVLTVRDEGVGIGTEFLPQVFDLFAQGAPPPGSAASGLGIGLTLARGLVALHGGTIEVASEGAGCGSVFTVRLPAASASRSGADTAGEARAAATTRRRVLVVDDNEDAAMGLAELLNLRGHEVRVSRDGRSAIEMAAGFRPEIVLLDIGLPDMDGYQVAIALRALPGLDELSIIAISGFEPDRSAQNSALPLFTRHLVKPVDWPSLERLLGD